MLNKTMTQGHYNPYSDTGAPRSSPPARSLSAPVRSLLYTTCKAYAALPRRGCLAVAIDRIKLSVMAVCPPTVL